MRKTLRSSIVLLLLANSQTVFAWGPVGHRTVANIADQFLTPATKQVLSKYLNGTSLADASVWADQIRDKPAVWSATYDYHFESISDNQTYIDSLKAKKPEDIKNGGLVAALLESKRIFKNPAAKPEDRNIALKFLIHFVGDIHQPLHSGRPEDRGGNAIQRKWNGRSSNLHAIWDAGILDVAYGKGLPTESELTRAGKKPQIDDEMFAQFLIDKYQGKGALPHAANDVNGWVIESMPLRDMAYEYKEESDASYTDLFVEDVDQRIYYGGVRLAAVLTSLVKNETDSQLELGFRKAIEDILGPLDQIIDFAPKNAKIKALEF